MTIRSLGQSFHRAYRPRLDENGTPCRIKPAPTQAVADSFGRILPGMLDEFLAQFWAFRPVCGHY